MFEKQISITILVFQIWNENSNFVTLQIRTDGPDLQKIASCANSNGKYYYCQFKIERSI